MRTVILISVASALAIASSPAARAEQASLTDSARATAGDVVQGPGRDAGLQWRVATAETWQAGVAGTVSKGGSDDIDKKDGHDNGKKHGHKKDGHKKDKGDQNPGYRLPSDGGDYGDYNPTPPPATPTPEPGTLLLMGLGAGAVGVRKLVRRGRRG